MDRRQSLQYITGLLGASFISTELFLVSCKPKTEIGDDEMASEAITFDKYQELLDQIGETILPASGKHPGFKAIDGGLMTAHLLNDCYTPDKQKLVADGLETLAKESDLKTALTNLDASYFDYSKSNDQKPMYYGILKEAVLLSYFTNEKIMTEVLTYVKVPGKYDGALKVEEGSYATMFGFGAL